MINDDLCCCWKIIISFSIIRWNETRFYTRFKLHSIHGFSFVLVIKSCTTQPRCVCNDNKLAWEMWAWGRRWDINGDIGDNVFLNDVNFAFVMLSYEISVWIVSIVQVMRGIGTDRDGNSFHFSHYRILEMLFSHFALEKWIFFFHLSASHSRRTLSFNTAINFMFLCVHRLPSTDTHHSRLNIFVVWSGLFRAIRFPRPFHFPCNRIYVWHISFFYFCSHPQQHASWITLESLLHSFRSIKTLFSYFAFFSLVSLSTCAVRQ